MQDKNHDTSEQRMDLVGKMIAFEHGELDEDDTIDLFRHLEATGMIHHLQGCYGRYAAQLREEGHL